MGKNLTQDELLLELKSAFQKKVTIPENAVMLSKVARVLTITVGELKSRIDNGDMPDGWRVEVYKIGNGKNVEFLVKNE